MGHGKGRRTMTYSLEVRPLSLLPGGGYQLASLDTPWVVELDPDADGIYIPVTGMTNLGLVPDVAAISDAIDDINVTFLQSTQTPTYWKLTTDGGSKAVSHPQRSIEDASINSWFLNLCCLQGTLGQIATQVNLLPALTEFRSNLFPRLQVPPLTAFSNNLGAWNIELRANLTRTQAEMMRARIKLELPYWGLVLMQRANPLLPPVQVGTADIVPLIKPNLLTLLPSIYPPSGEKCLEEDKRPVGPFPPDFCGGHWPGDCHGCYYPVKRYPACCFSRTNFPLKRGCN